LGFIKLDINLNFKMKKGIVILILSVLVLSACTSKKNIGCPGRVDANKTEQNSF